jgi:hypothetical protein
MTIRGRRMSQVRRFRPQTRCISTDPFTSTLDTVTPVGPDGDRSAKSMNCRTYPIFEQVDGSSLPCLTLLSLRTRTKMRRCWSGERPPEAQTNTARSFPTSIELTSQQSKRMSHGLGIRAEPTTPTAPFCCGDSDPQDDLFRLVFRSCTRRRLRGAAPSF